MSDLKSCLEYLNIAASRNPFPIYASYLHSDGKKVRTMNDYCYVEMECELPFVGSVNFFILESILKRISFEPIMQVVGNNLEVMAGSKFTLPINTLEYPQHKLPSISMSPLTEETIDSLKLATRFIGGDVFSHICLTSKGEIYTTDTERLFFDKIDLNLSETVGIDKVTLSMIEKGKKTGLNNSILYIEIDGGWASFALPLMGNYPVAKIGKFIKSSGVGLRKICNMSEFKNAITSISPIFFGEQICLVDLDNENNRLYISAESKINGKADVVINSECDEKFKLSIDSTLFRGIPIEFDIFLGEYKNRLILKDGNGSLIVLVGEG